MSQIIELNQLSKVFKLKHKAVGFWPSVASLVKPSYREIKAVNNMSISVRAGELVAFIGPNGAGKSTTIKMLTGILNPSAGQSKVLGYDPFKQRKALAFHIGTVFGQKPQLWYHLPALDTYRFFAKIYELKQPQFESRLKFLIEAFEIGSLLEVPVRKLSLGQRMRCEIVASLIHSPKIVFLDEPTIGLDVVAKQHIREVIKHLNRTENTTIFLTSHDPTDIESLAERTIVINHGELIFDDSTKKFKKEFIKSKRVEFIVTPTEEEIHVPFGKVVERENFRVKVEVETSGTHLKQLLSYAVQNYDLKDINIYDPEMEEIISAIYTQGKKL